MVAAGDSDEKKMITLKSLDGKEFKVEEAVAMESQTIRHMIEDDCANNGIPLPNVNSKILSKVIEYCNKHVQAKPADGAAAAGGASASDAAAAPAEDLKNWDAEFVKVDQATLFDLILVRDGSHQNWSCWPRRHGAEPFPQHCRERLPHLCLQQDDLQGR